MEINGYEIKRRANLSNADLSNADLRRANLSRANLLGANLRGVSFFSSYFGSQHHVFGLSGVGSENRVTNCYVRRGEDAVIFCGCFEGSFEEWESKICERYGENKYYLKQYLSAVEYLKTLVKNWEER